MQVAPSPIRVLVVTARAPVDAFVRIATANRALVRQARHARDLQSLLRAWPPHVVVVDAADGQGPTAVSRVRSLVADLPLLALTARANPAALVEAFDAGADEVVTLPSERPEFYARLRALLSRRERKERAGKLEFGPFVIERTRKNATLGGRALKLTPLEFALLHLLVSARGKVVAKDTILLELWGDRAPTSNVVEQNVRRLRHKIHDKAALRIVGTRGLGYFVEGALGPR